MLEPLWSAEPELDRQPQPPDPAADRVETKVTVLTHGHVSSDIYRPDWASNHTCNFVPPVIVSLTY